MHELQNPMTGISNLESQLKEGVVTRRVPFTDDIHLIKDKAFGEDRYTFVRRKKMKCLNWSRLMATSP